MIVEFNDNQFPGAGWYAERLEMRYPLVAQPWPQRSPSVVRLSRDRYEWLAFLSYLGDQLRDIPGMVDCSLGSHRGSEAGAACCSSTLWT